MKTAETINRALSLLQQHLQLHFSVSTATSAIHQAFETMPLCASFYVPFRQLVIRHQIIDLFDIAEDFDFQCSVIVCSELSSRLNPPPFKLTVHSTTFHLVSLFGEGKVFFVTVSTYRIGGQFLCLILLPPNVTQPQCLKVCTDHGIFCYMCQTIIILLLVPEVCFFFGGQDVCTCSTHKTYLSLDIQSSVFRCSVADFSRTSAWRCPVEFCGVSICSNQFWGYSERFDSFVVAASSPSPSNNSVDSEMESNNLAASSMDHPSSPPNISVSNDSLSLVNFVGIEETGAVNTQ